MQETGVQRPTMSDGEFVPMRQGRNYQPLSPAGSSGRRRVGSSSSAPRARSATCARPWADPSCSDDERFRTNNGRLEHRDELTDADRGVDGHVRHRRRRHGGAPALRVPVGPVLSPADALDHQYFLERGMVRGIEDPQAGSLAIPGFPIRFGDAPARRRPDRPRGSVSTTTRSSPTCSATTRRRSPRWRRRASSPHGIAEGRAPGETDSSAPGGGSAHPVLDRTGRPIHLAGGTVTCSLRPPGEHGVLQRGCRARPAR